MREGFSFEENVCEQLLGCFFSGERGGREKDDLAFVKSQLRVDAYRAIL